MTDSTVTISLLLPTRGRPDMLRRMIRSALDTADSPEGLEIIVNVDDDDEATLAVDFSGLQTTVIHGPPKRSMGLYNTQCLEESSGEVVILCNDDVVVRTRGWDRLTLDAAREFGDGVFLMYPNDLFKGARLCTFPILSRAACGLMTTPFPEEYQGAFIDTHLMDVFKRLEHAGHARIRFLEHVVFEHCHYRTGKSEFDETYRTRDRFGDDLAFLNLLPLRREQSLALAGAVSDSQRPVQALRRGDAEVSYLRGVLNLFLDRTTGVGWRNRMAFHFFLRWAYQHVTRPAQKQEKSKL